MNILALCVALIMIMLSTVFLRNWYVEKRVKRLLKLKLELMSELLEKLNAGTRLSTSDIIPFAINPALRIALHAVLASFNVSHLMPKEFNTEERGAESYLVNWLEFPTELGRAPDEIGLMRVIVLDAHEQLRYYVFKFKTSKPRWAARLGWMLGVCGPYDDQMSPFDQPLKIFSRFNKAAQISPEEEVRWVHEHINAH
jgi:hypothetical protein